VSYGQTPDGEAKTRIKVDAGWSRRGSRHSNQLVFRRGGQGRCRAALPSGIAKARLNLKATSPDESHSGRRARTYRERTFRSSIVSVPMESLSMRATRIRKRPMAVAPAAIAPIPAAPRAKAPAASARMAVLPVSIASVALFVWVEVLSRSPSSHAGITANSELDRQELRSRHMRPISARMRQQVVSPRLHRYRTPCPNACE